MKALRYLLSVMMVLGVLSVSAQTPKYGKPYKPYGRSDREIVQQQAQMPVATMSSTSSELVSSGSTLPQAAVTGTTMADDTGERFGRIRRDVGGGGTTEDEDDPDIPVEPNPIGDGLWALMVLAGAFAFGKWIARTKPLR